MSNFPSTIFELMQGRQNQRILRLAFPNNDGPPCLLLAHKLTATEELSRDFEYRVEVLAEDASLPLKEMQGKLVSISLVKGDGTLRYFTGYVFEFRMLKTDGGFAFYAMVLKPWLAYLSLRKNSFLFHQKTLRDQCSTIFSEYEGVALWDCQLRSNDPVVTMSCQFGESDHNYLHRRWEAAGWYYWYEHSELGHKLILSDDSTCAAPIDGDPAIPFQRHAGALEEDGIGEWSPARHLSASTVSLASFDFKNPRPQHASVNILNEQGDVPVVETFEYAGALGFYNQADGDRQATLRMDEIEASAKRFDGRGNNRRAQPGRSFQLEGHFDTEADSINEEFLIVSVRHEASNNYLQNIDEPAFYGNQLVCIRKKIQWRPGRGHNSQDTRIFGIQTATVVGPAGENLHVDNFGRVRVQFHWDRIGRDDQDSSAWVRVASNWAGSQMGFVAVPRIGQSVLVQWLDGNCDRPVITGLVANKDNMPPWALPSQLTLTGMRSRELVPGGGNSAQGRSGHLIFDDCSGQIQTQLKSDHLHSQLSLGHITRIDDNAGRQDSRGEGFELRSDGVGVVRAAAGMLITSEPRPQGQGHLTDMSETIQRLTTARDTHENLAGLAQEHQAQDKGVDQSDVARALKLQIDGIKGSKGSDGGFPELIEPHLVLASPSGIETTTSSSTHIASGEHLALSAGGHVSIATNKSLYASVAEKFSVFVHQLGIKLIAASGKVQIQSQTDDMELLAQKVLDIISTTGWINLKAKEGIRLNAGGTELVLNADGITGCTNGVSHIHAADHQTMGPKAVPVKFPGAQVCGTRTAGAAQAGAAAVPLE